VAGRPNAQPPMRFPQPDDVFQLRISLVDVEPTIWRRLLVAQDVVLPRLHSIIQAAMGWKDSHMHQFKVGEVRFGEPDDEYEPGPIEYRRISLNQILPRRGSSCVYEYDFGDGWEHLIELEDELPIDQVSARLPQCIAGERACPPEDCGGPHGYMEFLAAIKDPRHEEHESLLGWAGGSFDPQAFDIDRVNRLLSRFRNLPSRRGRR
jgi:pRiA4b ORF-3-like protein